MPNETTGPSEWRRRLSLRHLTLGDLRQEDLGRLLAEGETLFVEHKRDIARGSGFQLAKAAASFANSMGGWIVIGHSDDPSGPAWTPPPGDLVDTVRQRLERHVDPLPSFAAGVFEHSGRTLGLVRVHESADTPHILSDGAIVVREPAQDAKIRKLGGYEASPVRSHYEMLQLAQRGERARRDAEARFEAGPLSPVDRALALRLPTGPLVPSVTPALVLRLAPLTVGERWRRWATSSAAVRALENAVSRLTDSSAPPVVSPHPHGFSLAAHSTRAEAWTPGASIRASRSAVGALEAGGVLGVALAFRLTHVGGMVHYQRRLGDGQPMVELLAPLLAAATRALSAGELLGRYAVHLRWIEMGQLFRRDPTDEDEAGPPADLASRGSVTIAGGVPDDDPETVALMDRWIREFGRACGLPLWDP